VERDKRNVLLLGTTSFFNDISSETIFALLPLYVGSSGVIGILGGIISGFGDIVKVYFGYLSDHLGKRKPVVFAGYLLSAISKFLITMVATPFLVLVLIMDRLGKGVREGPRDAILSVAKKKGWAFGLRQAMDTMGAVVGGLIAYYFLSSGADYVSAMRIAAFIGLGALVPLLFIKVPPFKRTEESFSKTLGHVSWRIWRVLVIAVLFGLVLVSPLILVKTSYDQLGNTGVLVYTAFNVVYALASKTLGAMSDTYGRKAVLNLSFVSAAFAFLLAFAGGWAVLPGFLLYGLALGAFRSTSGALVSDIAGRERATALGLFQTTLGVSVFIGSSLFGILLDTVGSITYLLGTLLSTASLLTYNFLLTSARG